ncbi:MAG TPA: DUF5995 family protein [Micromonosporaceae bacterium]|nr:DUF5995 family protein [Micromonosporaceae bacterium]
MTGRIRRATVAALLAVVTAMTLSPAAARAAVLPPDNYCPDGQASCVDATIAEMRQRFEPLGRSCHHNAVFALAYLRTTQTYKWARDQSGFFADPAWVNHEDAVFAAYYFTAYDDWAAGRRAAVPQAWLIALDAARDRRVTGAGDVMLGMNAHINRDLPFVLAAIGLTRPDGSSRKPDHDKVNDFLRLVGDPLLAEEAVRFDPFSFASLGSGVMFSVLVQWRERAWQNAERLVAAPDDAARAAVAADIESAAATEALSLRTLNAYVPPFTTTWPRDLYCAGHHATAPPQPYPFGTPSAY